MIANENDYVIEVLDSPLDIDPVLWNSLLACQEQANPFMRHEYLAAMHQSASASTKTGWTPRFITLWKINRATQAGDPPARELHGACALYLKAHSYGEYVFDHAWANAYHQHGLTYYPKALIAPPFTPVPGARLLARDAGVRLALVKAVIGWCETAGLSSLHILFASDADMLACVAAGMMVRHNVQFHWTAPPGGYRDFDAFLMSLSQEKRKKNPPGAAQGGTVRRRVSKRARRRHQCPRLGLLLPLLRAHLLRTWQRAVPQPGFFPPHGAGHAGKLVAVRGPA